MNMNFRLNLKTVAIVLVCLFVIWIFSTCGCTHGGAYGLYEGITDIANAKEGAGVTVKTSVPVVAVDTTKSGKTTPTTSSAMTPSNPSTGGKSAPKATSSSPAPAPAPAPVTPPSTDKKGNASVSATASAANPKEGYTNLMGYNSNNSTVNWGDPAPVMNYVPPSPDNPLSQGELNMFANTAFKPECCPTTYSNSMGCACINMDQYNYLITRGGNNVPYAII
jgi:hypothetical protein